MQVRGRFGALGQRRNLERWTTAASPALPGRLLNVAHTLVKCCERFTNRHGMAGTVSGNEAAIHCGDELFVLALVWKCRNGTRIWL